MTSSPPEPAPGAAGGESAGESALVRDRAQKRGWFDVSTLKEPYRAEGKKTMGLELAEQFGWDVPDVIIYPTGGGTGIIGIWKAFEELEELGFIGPRRPRMISVQAAGCAPIVRAFLHGLDHAPPWQNAWTLASGLRVPGAVADYLILSVIRKSAGTALTVTDDEILEAKAVVDASGVGCEPASAASVAGVRRLAREGVIRPGERVVAVLTGHVLKDPAAVTRYHVETEPAPARANRPVEIEPTLEAVSAALLRA